MRKGIREADQAAVKLIRDTLKGEIAEVIEARMAKLGEVNRVHQPTASPEVTTEMHRPPKGHGAARCLRYMYAARNDVARAIQMARENNDGYIAEIWEESVKNQGVIAKAMGQDTLAGGGALLPPEFSMEIIEELGAKAVVRDMGLTVLPMNGSLTMSYIDDSASAYYVGEASNGTESTPTTGQLQLNEKTLIALGVMSNQLLMNGGARVDTAIKNHLVRILKRKEDITFIRSAGSSNEPRGMRYQAVAANVNDANGTVNVANVTIDLGEAVNGLMSNDVDLDGGTGWIISPRSYMYLTTARDGNNNLVWQPEMAQGRLVGYPYKVTSQIPENLGSGTNESEVYFASFKTLVLGESETMEMAVFPDGAYHDGSSVVSGISTYQTPVRIVSRHDLGAQQRGKEIYVLTAVKWGV